MFVTVVFVTKMCLFCCSNSLVSHRKVLIVVYMCCANSDRSFVMLFAMVYAKILEMV